MEQSDNRYLRGKNLSPEFPKSFEIGCLSTSLTFNLHKSLKYLKDEMLPLTKQQYFP
jgi:hypothetical protein